MVNVPVQNTTGEPDGGLTGLGIGSPTPAPVVQTGTTTASSSDATASSTEAVASSTEEVAGEVVEESEAADTASSSEESTS